MNDTQPSNNNSSQNYDFIVNQPTEDSHGRSPQAKKRMILYIVLAVLVVFGLSVLVLLSASNDIENSSPSGDTNNLIDSTGPEVVVSAYFDYLQNNQPAEAHSLLSEPGKSKIPLEYLSGFKQWSDENLINLQDCNTEDSPQEIAVDTTLVVYTCLTTDNSYRVEFSMSLSNNSGKYEIDAVGINAQENS